MITLPFILSIFTAYLLGAIPTAVWYGKSVHRIDVRQYGSGNPGATNTFRVLGKKAGIVVMLGDIIKGLLATSLAVLLLKLGYLEEPYLVVARLTFGVVAVTGHIFPVFLNFKGGKGVATLLGMMVGIHYEVALLCVAVFIITLLISKYVSLASILGTLAFPSLLLFIPRFKDGELLLIIFGFFLFIVILWTHAKNIQRIVTGSENKTFLIKSQRRN